MEEFKRSGLLREEDLRRQKDDPNSEISKNAAKALQESFKLIGYTNTEPFKNLSLTQIEANPMLKSMMDSATRKYSADEMAKARKEAAALAAEAKAEANQTKQEEKRQKEGKLSDKQAENVNAYQESMDALNTMASLFSNKFVGPERAAVKNAPLLGTLYKAARPVEEATFDMMLDQYNNAYRKLITGAAASTKEMEMLRQANPSKEDTPAQFQAKLKQAIGIIEKNKKTYLDTLAKSGKIVDSYRETAGVAGPSENKPTNKTVAKKQYSPSADKTKLIYTDGTEEILDGRQ
jgi:hypothetical protein